MNFDPIENQRHDRAALEAEIRAAGSTIRGDQCNCPHPDHEDRNPSAAIHAGADGVWRVTCFSRSCFGPKGADIFDLRAALTGKPIADVLRESRGDNRPTGGRPTQPTTPAPDMLSLAKQCTIAITPEQLAHLAEGLGVSADALRRLRVGWLADQSAFTFPMRNASGKVVGIRTRYADGRKAAVRGSANGLFIPADLCGDGALHVCEGPTDCAALIDMGLAAIGRPSNSAGEDLIVGYVRQHPRDSIVIFADRDTKPSTAAATISAAERLTRRLIPIVGSVRIVQPPEPFKDVRAWRLDGAMVDDVDALVEATPSRGPAGELRAVFAAEIDGTRRAVPWPWRLVTRGTQALIPGAVTLIAGDPGSGKSLWLLEALARWTDDGIPCAIFELEKSRSYHMRRALAQRVGAAWLTDPDEVMRRPCEAMAYQSEHATWTDGLGRTMYDAPLKPMTLAGLIQWTIDRAEEGARIIAIDPITAIESTERSWEDSQRFLQTVMPVLDRVGASLICVTHPRKGKQRASANALDDLAGGAGWQRFTDTILWLERHDEPKSVTIKGGDSFPIPEQVQVNRTLRVMKARNGRGAGWSIAFDFDPGTLRFTERGAIAKTNRTSKQTQGGDE
ncbi:MAG: AAA family ATPase [Phycisphaeraceae bacterium]